MIVRDIEYHMDQRQIVNLKSSWNVQGPYDVNSVLKFTFETCDSDNDILSCDQTSPAHTLQLIPAQNADNTHTSCQMWLSCKQDIRTVAMEIVSSARNIEFYDDQGGYCCTVRGEKLAEEDEQFGGLSAHLVYKTNIVTERPLALCSFKFLSLVDKTKLFFKNLNVKLVHEADEEHTIGGAINMTRVREMMSSMEQPVPERVENLMQTVEQYQKNQASVMKDLQQTAMSRTLGPKDPMANQMTGLLSALAKANSMQSEMTRRSLHRLPPGGVATSLPDNSSGQTPSSQPHGRTSSCNSSTDVESQDPASQVLEKLMSALSTGGASVNSEIANSPDFYSAMQSMCSDLSRVKAQERRLTAVEGGDASSSDGQEKETSEIPQEKNQQTLHNSPSELRLMGYVVAMEERIVQRLERKLEDVRDHMDVRLNRLEALLMEQSQARTGQAPQEQDLD